MARASHNQTVTAGTPVVVFRATEAGGADGAVCRAVRLTVPAASASDLLVSVTGVHGSVEFARVRIGQTQEFIAVTPGGGAITIVTVDAPAGVSTYDYTVSIS